MPATKTKDVLPLTNALLLISWSGYLLVELFKASSSVLPASRPNPIPGAQTTKIHKSQNILIFMLTKDNAYLYNLYRPSIMTVVFLFWGHSLKCGLHHNVDEFLKNSFSKVCRHILVVYVAVAAGWMKMFRLIEKCVGSCVCSVCSVCSCVCSYG